jgi:hypothetical protein
MISPQYDPSALLVAALANSKNPKAKKPFHNNLLRAVIDPLEALSYVAAWPALTDHCCPARISPR